MEHSNFSPSRLHRIIKCPGSVELIDSLTITKTIPKETVSTYAAEGTRLHGLTENYFMQGSIALKNLEIEDKYLITECIDYLGTVIASKGHQSLDLYSERKVTLENWGIPDVWGTLDYTVIDPIKRHIDIFDWKFGSGVTVYAEENPQLLAYAAGAIKWPTTINSITLHIVQPAIEHFDSWNLTTNDLYEWVHGVLAIAINKTISCHEFYPGDEQCRFCEAKNHCRARFDFVQDMAVKLFKANETLATCPKPEELIKLLEQAPLVEKTVKDIYNYVQREMEKGIHYPGLKLVYGRSNRAWIDEKETIKWLAENTNIEELYNSKLKSPAMLEKELKALKSNDEFKKLYHNPQGKVTVVSENDKREAIKVSADTTAVDVFKDYQDPDKSD